MADSQSSKDVDFIEKNKLAMSIGSVLGTLIIGVIFGTLIDKLQNRQRTTLNRLIVLYILIGLGLSHNIICLHSIWKWFVEREKIGRWPHLVLSLLSGILVGGVHLEMAYRGYISTKKRDPTIPTILTCLAIAEAVFGGCRLMELHESWGFSDFKSKPALYSFWISCVLIADTIVTLYTWYLISRLHLLIELETWNQKMMFVILSTHFLTLVLALVDLILFFTRVRSIYLAIDLCLANFHVLSLILGTDISILNRSLPQSSKRKSKTRNSRNLTFASLEVEVPMNRLSSRFQPSRRSDEMEETLINTHSDVVCQVPTPARRVK